MEKHVLDIILPHLDHWGYYALLMMTFLETSAFLGLIIPGESIVVIAGLLASSGVLELGDVIWVASLGAIMGDTVGYFIGHSMVDPLVKTKNQGVFSGSYNLPSS